MHMKRLFFLNCLLFSIFFYTFHSVCENIVVEPLIPSSWVSPFQSSITKPRPQEGFSANTLVQTPFGYKEIKKLSVDDVVIGCKGREKSIVAITKDYVSRCVKLTINNTTFYTGYDQRYYRYPLSWTVPAHKIRPGDMLCNDNHEGCLVTNVELLKEDKLLYYLTVENHMFCIAPCDVWVHNAEPLVLGLSSMCLGSVTVINPVVAMIGATVILSTVGHNAYQAYMQQSSNDDVKPLPTHVMLAERSYYIERSNALGVIKQELLSIKNGLENLKALYDIGKVNFTYQFLQQAVSLNTRQHNQFLQITSTREMQLSDTQKENLRTLRETQLKHIEQEIVDLQVALIFHINALIEQVYVADNEYNNVAGEINDCTTTWNDHRCNMTDAIALQSYKAHLLDECLLQNFDQKVNELKIVANYYNNCITTACLKQSTNIFDLLEKMNAVIVDCEQRIAKEKSRIARNIGITEQYFARRRIFIENVKNEIKTQLQKNRNSRNTQAIAEAKSKLENIVVAGSPQNNNNKKDDDKNEHPNGIYKDAPYHTSFGNSVKSKAPSNGQRALDNSVSVGTNSSRRIAISDGEFVVLDQTSTSPEIFHGHVRGWADLTDQMKRALVNSNLVSLKGKIK
jgi:Tfp pilus assembly protein PilE